MTPQQANSSPAHLTTRIAGPHVAQTFDTGEALLLRAKQISHQVEERVRRLLQDEQQEPRGPRR